MSGETPPAPAPRELISIHCPACLRQARVPATVMGRGVKCGACDHRFVCTPALRSFPAPSSPPGDAAPAQPAAPAPAAVAAASPAPVPASSPAAPSVAPQAADEPAAPLPPPRIYGAPSRSGFDPLRPLVWLSLAALVGSLGLKLVGDAPVLLAGLDRPEAQPTVAPLFFTAGEDAQAVLIAVVPALGPQVADPTQAIATLHASRIPGTVLNPGVLRGGMQPLQAPDEGQGPGILAERRLTAWRQQFAARNYQFDSFYRTCNAGAFGLMLLGERLQRLGATPWDDNCKRLLPSSDSGIGLLPALDQLRARAGGDAHVVALATGSAARLQAWLAGYAAAWTARDSAQILAAWNGFGDQLPLAASPRPDYAWLDRVLAQPHPELLTAGHHFIVVSDLAAFGPGGLLDHLSSTKPPIQAWDPATGQALITHWVAAGQAAVDAAQARRALHIELCSPTPSAAARAAGDLLGGPLDESDRGAFRTALEGKAGGEIRRILLAAGAQRWHEVVSPERPPTVDPTDFLAFAKRGATGAAGWLALDPLPRLPWEKIAGGTDGQFVARADLLAADPDFSFRAALITGLLARRTVEETATAERVIEQGGFPQNPDPPTAERLDAALHWLLTRFDIVHSTGSQGVAPVALELAGACISAGRESGALRELRMLIPSSAWRRVVQVVLQPSRREDAEGLVRGLESPLPALRELSAAALRLPPVADWRGRSPLYEVLQSEALVAVVRAALRDEHAAGARAVVERYGCDVETAAIQLQHLYTDEIIAHFVQQGPAGLRKLIVGNVQWSLNDDRCWLHFGAGALPVIDEQVEQLAKLATYSLAYRICLEELRHAPPGDPLARRLLTRLGNDDDRKRLHAQP